MAEISLEAFRRASTEAHIQRVLLSRVAFEDALSTTRRGRLVLWLVRVLRLRG